MNPIPITKWATAAVMLLAAVAVAGKPASKSEASQAAADASARWLVLCCGLPGDAEHRERLTEACRKIILAANPTLGVSPERVRVLVGDETMREALHDVVNEADICTQASTASLLGEIANEVRPADGCWVVLLGHAHLYDAHSWFNVSGPDFDQADFAEWASPLACREQVFWLTMPISGFWVKPLAEESRVILSATEPDLEFTGTEMPYALADVLAGEAQHQSLEDIDGDEALSLLDLYLATAAEVRGRFAALDRLQTEHAQLEDNGDGRGHEVQQKYLPPPGDDAEEAFEPAEPVNNEGLDGYRSRQIMLNRLP